MKNLFKQIDAEIFYKRQQGYTPRDILQYFQTQEPYLDDLLCLTHIARVSQEKGMPFSQKQIKRLFNEIFSLQYHGERKTSWNFLKTFCSKKLIVFKYEKAQPCLKHPSVTHKILVNKPVGDRFSKKQTTTYKIGEMAQNGGNFGGGKIK